MIATQKHTATVPTETNEKPLVLRVETFLYRAPEPRTALDLVGDYTPGNPRSRFQRRLLTSRGPAYSLYWDTLTVSDLTYPLRWHSLAVCLDLKSNPVTHFTKKGGGGTPLSPAQDLRQVVTDLLRDFRSFPRGWTPRPGLRFLTEGENHGPTHPVRQ